MKKITLFIGLLLFLLACTTSKDISADSEIVDLELNSDYHEIHYDNNDELKSLFKSREREVRLNQLGI